MLLTFGVDFDRHLLEELIDVMDDYDVMQKISHWTTDRIVQALILSSDMEDTRVVRALNMTKLQDNQIAEALVKAWGRSQTEEVLRAEWSSIRVDAALPPKA
jgi:hypothetical protein